MNQPSRPDTQTDRPTLDPFKKVRVKNGRTRDSSREAYTRGLLESANPANRAEMQRYIQAKRSQGLKPSSLQNLTVALSYLDQAAAGTRFADLSPDELTAILDQYTANHSPA